MSGQHIDSRNLATGQALISSIPDRISTTLGLRFLDRRLVVGTRLSWTDHSVKVASTDDATFLPTKGYNLVDLFATYHLSQNVTGDLIIKNVFNREYTQYLNTLPSAGLSVKGALTVRFAS